MVVIREHTGERAALRPLFALAEDSARELDAHLYDGRVLVALDGGRIVGHVQLIGAEIKNVAVAGDHQRRGVGRALLEAAFALARAEGHATIVVATASTDTGNLRFYERLGFTRRSVERDAFPEAAGYPPGLGDRVWLDRPLSRGRGPTP